MTKLDLYQECKLVNIRKSINVTSINRSMLYDQILYENPKNIQGKLEDLRVYQSC